MDNMENGLFKLPPTPDQSKIDKSTEKSEIKNKDLFTFPGLSLENPFVQKFGQTREDYLNELLKLPIGNDVIYGKMNSIIVEVTKDSTPESVIKQYDEKVAERQNQNK
jgi:hypothetical protein